MKNNAPRSLDISLHAVVKVGFPIGMNSNPGGGRLSLVRFQESVGVMLRTDRVVIPETQVVFLSYQDFERAQTV